MLMVKPSLPLYRHEGKKEDVNKVVRKTIIFCILLCVSIDLIKILLTWQSNEASKGFDDEENIKHQISSLNWIFETMPKFYYQKSIVIVDIDDNNHEDEKRKIRTTTQKTHSMSKT